nr:reverse transcriptase domain-containing protein [Tanacetum cinerariifolium]
MSLKEMEDLKQHYLDEMLSLSNDLGIKDYRNKKIDIRFRRECEDTIHELKEKFNGMSIEVNKRRERQYLEQVTNLSAISSQRFNSFCYDDDDDYDYEESAISLNETISQEHPSIANTPVLPTLEPEDSLITGNEELSTIPEKESDELIKSTIEDLIPIPERTFLGYKVSSKGLKVCSDKVDVVLSIPSPECLKDVQKLNEKLASLNRFLAKSAEKSLPFFRTLKKCTKKSDFHWSVEAEEAFKQMKQLIAELPMLVAPMKNEELIVYLAAVKETVSVVLITEREAKQMPIYFVSRVLRGPEINYTSMEKLVIALVHASDIA